MAACCRAYALAKGLIGVPSALCTRRVSHGTDLFTMQCVQSSASLLRARQDTTRPAAGSSVWWGRFITARMRVACRNQFESCPDSL